MCLFYLSIPSTPFDNGISGVTYCITRICPCKYRGIEVKREKRLGGGGGGMLKADSVHAPALSTVCDLSAVV